MAHSSIRFGIGRFNTEEEVDYVANKVIDVVRKLRELSPLYEMAKEGVDLSQGLMDGALNELLDEEGQPKWLILTKFSIITIIRAMWVRWTKTAPMWDRHGGRS